MLQGICKSQDLIGTNHPPLVLSECLTTLQ